MKKFSYMACSVSGTCRGAYCSLPFRYWMLMFSLCNALVCSKDILLLSARIAPIQHRYYFDVLAMNECCLSIVNWVDEQMFKLSNKRRWVMAQGPLHAGFWHYSGNWLVLYDWIVCLSEFTSRIPLNYVSHVKWGLPLFPLASQANHSTRTKCEITGG